MNNMQNNNSKDKQVPDITDPEEVNEILRQRSRDFAETLTGTAGLFFGEKGVMAGRVLQGWMNNNLIQQLGREINSLQEKGKIQENYLERAIDRSNFLEILKFIDEETPDEHRFRAMKSIFLTAVENDSDEAQKYLAYELAQICKRLSSGEILLLKAVKEIRDGDFAPTVDQEIFTDSKVMGVNQWLEEHAKQMGHKNSSLVELHEENLIENKLITHRNNGIDKRNNRLTSLGDNLCEFITKYDEDYGTE